MRFEKRRLQRLGQSKARVADKGGGQGSIDTGQGVTLPYGIA